MPRLASKSDHTTRSLTGLGLSENEAVLYAFMLGQPKCTAQVLAARAPFPRTMLYHVLGQLTTRGLITTKKDAWRTVYVAEDPERLYELLAHKEQELAKEAHLIREVIPHMKQRYHLAGARTSVRVFEGLSEYAKVLEDCIIAGPKEILSYESPTKSKPGLEVRDEHERRRLSKKIQKMVLYCGNEVKAGVITSKNYNDFTQYRSVHSGAVAPFEVDLMLYDGKILYTSYDAYEPTAVLIEDRALYVMQKNMFDSFWKTATDRTFDFTKTKKI
jgi:sugar-specific transcriptional regulator TrmB